MENSIMGSLDRFPIDRAASRAAPLPLPASKKPTSQGNALALARCVSIGCSAACGVAVFLGIFPQGGNASVLSYVLPFIAPPILAFGMAAAWHVVHGVGAHATELHRQVIALAFGAGLFLVGCFTSAWFLAAKIGGAGAIEAYQHQAIERLKRAGEVVAGNASADTALLAAVEHGGDALRIAAVSEDKTGVVARGKIGKGVAFRGLSDAAESMAKVASDMRQQAGTRGDLLTAAQTVMSEAERDAATGDAAGFEQAFAKASETLNAVEKIRLSAAASSLGIGWAVDRSAAPHVNATLQEIEKVRQLSNSNRRAIAIPVYTAIDDRQAILNAPQPLAWIAAVMIEALPLAMLGLLLLLWREETPEPETRLPRFITPYPNGEPQPFQAAE
jgi:hypothetical protein